MRTPENLIIPTPTYLGLFQILGQSKNLCSSSFSLYFNEKRGQKLKDYRPPFFLESGGGGEMMEKGD